MVKGGWSVMALASSGLFDSFPDEFGLAPLEWWGKLARGSFPQDSFQGAGPTRQQHPTRHCVDAPATNPRWAGCLAFSGRSTCRGSASTRLLRGRATDLRTRDLKSPLSLLRLSSAGAGLGKARQVPEPLVAPGTSQNTVSVDFRTCSKGECKSG